MYFLQSKECPQNGTNVFKMRFLGKTQGSNGLRCFFCFGEANIEPFFGMSHNDAGECRCVTSQKTAAIQTTTELRLLTDRFNLFKT